MTSPGLGDIRSATTTMVTRGGNSDTPATELATRRRPRPAPRDPARVRGVAVTDCHTKPKKLKKQVYEAELARLQLELVKLQYWVKEKGLRVVALFEGRDAAGKGGTIQRIVEPLNPRGATVVALGTPTER